MTSDPVKIPAVTLKIKVMGKERVLDALGIEDALECAVSLISAGAAIPKGIFRGGLEVCSEQDINTYWEQSSNTKRA